jgi:hypothetical protein
VTRRPAVLYALAVALIAILVAVGARRAGRDVSRARTDRTVPVQGTVARPEEGDAAVARRAAGDAAPANARKLREVTGVACYLDGAPVAEAPLMFHGMRWLGRSIVYYDSAGADVRTGADGRFSVCGVTPAPGRIALAGCLDADPDEALYDAARDETALTVRRGRVAIQTRQIVISYVSFAKLSGRKRGHTHAKVQLSLLMAQKYSLVLPNCDL